MKSREFLGSEVSAQKLSFWTTYPKVQNKWRINLLLDMEYNGVCAEIGVQDGGFTECIIDICNPQKLHLIDVWAKVPDSMVGKDDISNKLDHDYFYNCVLDKFGKMNSVVISKGYSQEILQCFSANYFDWVYVDGSHQEDCVAKDLELCYKSVKNGGVIAGDDYSYDNGGFCAEVARSVDRFCKNKNLIPKFINNQYIISI